MTKLISPQTESAQKRTLQLQLISEITQVTGTNLDLAQLLHDAVYLIRDQFHFYHVSIFLIDESKQNLIITESTGEIGAALKAQNFNIAMTDNSIIGWAAVNRQARISHDVGQDPIYLLEDSLLTTRSEIALPLLIKDDLKGVLDVQSEQAHAFQEEDIAILQILANHIAINIEHAQLFTQIQQRLNETETLVNLNNLLTTTLDVGEIYRRAGRAFAEMLPVSRCVIASWEGAGQTFIPQVSYAQDMNKGVIKQDGLEPYRLDERESIQPIFDKQQPLLNSETGSLVIPLRQADMVTGIVELHWANTSRSLTRQEMTLAQAMTNQTAVALHNATLASEARSRVAQLSMINRLNTILSTSPTLKDVFDGANREIFSLLEATGMSILLLTTDKKHLWWIYGFEYGNEVDLTAIAPISIQRGFSGYVARTREMLHINKYMDELKWRQLESIQVGAAPNTWLGLPLIVANELIGVLAVENADVPDAFSDREVELLKIISGPLAIAINNLRQLETVQEALLAQSEQRIQLQTAAEVAAATTGILELAALIQQSVELIKERFSLYYVGLFLINVETNYAILRAGTGEPGRIQIEQNHQLEVAGRSLIGGATGDGVPRITQDVTLDKEWFPNPALPKTRSELALPMRVRGEIIGALTAQSVEPNDFSPELISTLQTMGDQLAVAIENARLLRDAEERIKRQQELNQISTRLYRATNVDDIVSIGLQAISQHLDGAKVALSLGTQEAET